MKTKDKIILASLDLFNEQGERNITTNHIAAHLGISPGNLYYHFRNKSDIIYAIFKNYELMVDTYIKLPANRKIQVQDLIACLDAVFNGLWAYRFLHRDLEHLLSNDEKLRTDYRQFTLRCLDAIREIIWALEQNGIYKPMAESQRQSKALNTWLIVTNWMVYLKTVHEEDDQKAIKHETITHGVYQVLDYILPYLSKDKVSQVAELQQSYHFDETMSFNAIGPVTEVVSNLQVSSVSAK